LVPFECNDENRREAPAVSEAEELGLPDRIKQVGLGLVAEALLVAIGLHTLAALMLADLGLPTLFEVSHNNLLLG